MYGFSGDQGCALSTFKICHWHVESTYLSPLNSRMQSCLLPSDESILTLMPSNDSRLSYSKSSTNKLFFLSMYTLCHIPLWHLYHIPCGFNVCFPLAKGPLSVGSTTRIEIEFFPSSRLSVSSATTGVYPPECLLMLTPFKKISQL